jgi:Na+/H+ antiporter NhaA
MALFIGGLAFNGDASLQAAKIGIVVGSIVAGIAGAIVLQVALAGRAGDRARD